VCQETGTHGFEAETGEAIPSYTVTGRPTAQAFWRCVALSPVGRSSPGALDPHMLSERDAELLSLEQLLAQVGRRVSREEMARMIEMSLSSLALQAVFGEKMKSSLRLNHGSR
jgi:hypothetical protein